MHIRSITPSEVDQFAAIAPHSLGADGFARYIRELWELGSSQPNRCFVIEENGVLIGRIVYRGQGEEVNFTGLHLPWDGDYLSIGEQLFKHTLTALKAQGVERLEAYATSALSYAEYVRALLDHLGLPLVQTKIRYVWTHNGDPLAPTDRLTYKTLNEIGEHAFVDLIKRASVDTLDRLDQHQIKLLGAQQHAQTYFDLLKTEFEFRPEWWLVGFTADNQAVGHVVGVPFNLHRAEASIGYIGVVPEQRGHGYVRDLLLNAMDVLVKDGIRAMVCDTDAQNIPMQKAFESCGYVATDTTWVYTARLDSILGE